MYSVVLQILKSIRGRLKTRRTLSLPVTLFRLRITEPKPARGTIFRGGCLLRRRTAVKETFRAVCDIQCRRTPKREREKERERETSSFAHVRRPDRIPQGDVPGRDYSAIWFTRPRIKTMENWIVAKPPRGIHIRVMFRRKNSSGFSRSERSLRSVIEHLVLLWTIL